MNIQFIMSFFFINKNKHKAEGVNIGFVFGKKKMCAEVSFMPSCTYSLSKNYDQINKLFGVSTSWLPFIDKSGFHPPHHKNSVRFGWRCIDGENIEVLAYIYVNKERIHKVIETCLPGDTLRLSLEIDNNDYLLKMVNMDGGSGLARVPSKRKNKRFFGYKLFPYFGGSVKAPHDMLLLLKRIEKII